MKSQSTCTAVILGTVALMAANPARSDPVATLEKNFRELPAEARRLTGPLFWMHGDETGERLESYLEKVAEGGNGSFTAESRPHNDWLGPRWFDDLEICLRKAKELDLKMWIFDERWWPSQSIGGTVPPRYAAKSLVAEAMDANGSGVLEGSAFGGERYIGAVAGRLTADNRFDGDTLLDLAPFIKEGKLAWQPPDGKWQIIRFTHKQAPGLGQRGGKELSVDGASRDCTEWFLNTVYQPHHDRFKDDFGKTIPGFFYDEPETVGDWGTELDVILKEWGVDWKKAYVAYKFQLSGDDDAAARYQYMEAIAEAWGRVMYGGMSQWCRERDVTSIGHFMEHGMLYVHPTYCAGDMMRLQKYSDMGAIDLVCRQMYPGQRPQTIYQTPKLGSSISHVYGKKDDIAMCEIFGGYLQKLTYPEMKWLTDQHQVRGINFMIPHSFNPKAPYDKDYPPYFYNDGHEPRWPLYRVWADYTSRLSLWLTGGHHVCPVAILFSGNARRVGNYVTPEDMTTVLQDALYDCDWLPFEAFENDARLDGADITLHHERYQVLIVPPTDVITLPVLAKAKAFFDQGGVVVGYGHLPSKSGTVGTPSTEVENLRSAIWGDDLKPSATACNRNAAGGRAYILAEKPDVAMITAALHQDAGIAPVVEVLEGQTDNWLHALHRVRDGSDVFLVCNQQHTGKAKTFKLRFKADGYPEIWDAMRNKIHSVPFTRDGSHVEIPLALEPMESVLVVFNKTRRPLPPRLTTEALAAATIIPVTGGPVPPAAPPKPIIDPSPTKKLTLSPVVANPFEGTCEVPAGLDPVKSRIILEMNGLSPEEAARITINGKDAGGFIGKPLHFDAAHHLTNGENHIRIEPFAPDSVRLLVITGK
jgi:alpha-L-rhamnosidase